MQYYDMTVVVKGAGEMATGVAHTLHRAGLHRIVMLDKAPPLAVRRTVAFCQALAGGELAVEGVSAVHAASPDVLEALWGAKQIAVCDDPQWHWLPRVTPHILIDATIAKTNLGTRLTDAPFVVGLGPGFTAGEDVHVVIETQRGHNLGRILRTGGAMANTGEPEAVLGHTHKRVLRAPCAGEVRACKEIGDAVQEGETIMTVNGQPVVAALSGVLRGLIFPGSQVPQGCKIGDIDPRGAVAYCSTISDKARALGGAVLTAVLHWYRNNNLNV